MITVITCLLKYQMKNNLYIVGRQHLSSTRNKHLKCSWPQNWPRWWSGWILKIKQSKLSKAGGQRASAELVKLSRSSNIADFCGLLINLSFDSRWFKAIESINMFVFYGQLLDDLALSKSEASHRVIHWSSDWESLIREMMSRYICYSEVWRRSALIYWANRRSS